MQPCACGQPREVAWRGAAEAEHGTVAVLVERVPTLVCADGHVRDLAAQVVEQAGGMLPVAHRRWPRGAERCFACNERLTLPGRRTQRTVSMVIDPAGVVTVTFDVPMLRCPGCATEQLPGRAAEDADSALRRALTD